MIGLCGLHNLRLTVILQLLGNAGQILLLLGLEDLVVEHLEDLLVHTPCNRWRAPHS